MQLQKTKACNMEKAPVFRGFDQINLKQTTIHEILLSGIF